MPAPARPAATRPRRRPLDDFERFALLLLASGLGLVVWGTLLAPPSGANGWVAEHAQDWAPGLVVDGLLLWVVNAIFRRHERERVLAQVGSLSREFALDAVRRARDEGWLSDGSLSGRGLTRAALAGADLGGARLDGADLSLADLGGANLVYADLGRARLVGADLSGADLRWADLRGADLQWADLRGAVLEGARLERMDARFASVDPGTTREPALAGAVEGGLLDRDEVEEIRRSFQAFLDAGPRAWSTFYERLFEQAPHLRPLFRSGPEEQARKLVQSLKVIVAGLDSPQVYVSVLQRLGERHRGYGVTDEHYGLVGEVLLATLSATLGEAFTCRSRRAWERAYTLMTGLMRSGSSPPVARAAT